MTDPVLTGENTDFPPLKPGLLTTEFWVTAVTAVLTLLAGFNVVGPDWAKMHEPIVNALAFLATAIIPAAYALSRAIAKGKHQAAAAALAAARIPYVPQALPEIQSGTGRHRA
jgi:hypothetical protein